MVLVIVEYGRQSARLHSFQTKQEAQSFVDSIRNAIGVVAAYLTDEGKKYQWPADLQDRRSE